MEDGTRWESDVSTRTSDAILNILKRLPTTWSQTRKARAIADSIGELEVDLDLPGSDAIYSWIEGICSTQHRRPGSPEGQVAEEWVEERFGEIGLDQVSVDPIPITVWNPDRWSLSVNGEIIPSFFIPNTGFTGPEGIRAPLVYAGKGRPDEMEKAGVKGKIVVAEVTFPVMPTGLALKGLRAAYYISDPDGSISLGTRQYLNFVRQNFIGGASGPETAPENDVYWQASAMGALGVCLVLRDQPSGSNTHYGPYDGIMKPIPGLWIGKYEGAELRELARTESVADLTLEGTMEPGVMKNIWGILPGSSNEVVMITSHHDSPFTGATEDGAGVAQVLAQARAWSRVPRTERPRTLVFVVDAGHFYGSQGGHAFAREHPDIMERTRLLITLEHLGAKEVVEQEREYVETGGQALTVMFTTPDPNVIAVAIHALREKPAKITAVVPSDLFAPVPTSDAAGYVVESGVPVISWIGCPYYLLDEHDTLEKVDKGEIAAIAATVAELVKAAMTI